AGAHVSAAGGVENAIVNAAKIGANAFALFLKSQRKWTGPPLSEASIAAFQRRLKAFGYSPSHVLPHGSYLVNMGNPDAEKREKSYQCFVDELKRCEQLGLELYNFHPGSTVGAATVAKSIGYIAECINRAHAETSSVVVVVENMAGAGNVIGGKFEELAGIIDKVDDKTRVGICLDTCHLFAAGYDIRTKEDWSNTMNEFDAVVGLKYLRGMHLNDSKEGLGGKKDRHENLGLGKLGLGTFEHIMTDARVQGIPLVLETPMHDDDGIWQTEIEVLHGLAVGSEVSVSLEEGARRVKDAVASAGGAAKKKSLGKRKKDASPDEDEDGCC
ncbi:xylose isomerase-like protein, partial [Amylostereum chailletii]